MECGFCYAVIAVLGAAALYVLHKQRQARKKAEMLEKWKHTSKDEVVVHGFFRAKTIPNAALFCLKLETYLRLANIKYTYDIKDPLGPKGKSPWISINGEHITDTEFIIEFLNKKFEKDLNQHCEPSTLAHATLIRVMFEEFFLWAITLERFEYGSVENFAKTVGQRPSLMFKLFLKFGARSLKNRAKSQGIGLHTQAEVTQLMTKYLKSASVALGNKKFFGGDEPCQEDCGIFGILGQCLWALPDSPYEKMLQGDCKNLKEYLNRMKEKAWPDWDKFIS